MSRRILFAILLVFVSLSQAQAGERDLLSLTTKNFLMSTAPTGCQPKGMKVDPSGEFVYLAEMCGKKDPETNRRVPTASIYSMRSRELVKTIVTPVGASPGIFANTEVEFSLQGQWAFVTRAEGDSRSEIFPHYGMVTVINASTQKIAKYIPVRGMGSKIIATRPLVRDDLQKKQIVYVANYFSDDISILDVTSLKDDGKLDGTQHLVGRIALHTNFPNPHSKAYFIAPRGIAFTPDGKYGVILATETGSLIVVDAVNHRQLVEIAPMSPQTAGREVNVRHVVISKDGKTAYLSHMRGNAISRINLSRLIQIVSNLPQVGKRVTLPAHIWDELLIPFVSATGSNKVLVLEDYPADHPNFANRKWDLAHPNTIVLDPIRNRYLYVSHRTTTNKDYRIVDPKIKGKIDIIDT